MRWRVAVRDSTAGEQYLGRGVGGGVFSCDVGGLTVSTVVFTVTVLGSWQCWKTVLVTTTAATVAVKAIGASDRPSPSYLGTLLSGLGGRVARHELIVRLVVYRSSGVLVPRAL